MSGHPVWRSSYALACILVLLMATVAASKVTGRRESGQLIEPLDSIPFEIGEFAGKNNPALPEGVLKALKATNWMARSYQKPGLTADVFIAFYSQQRAGESMHSPKHCLPGAGWEIWDYDTLEIPAGTQRFRVNKYSISHDQERRLVLYWYQSKDRIFASEYLGKILLARDALLQNSTAASIVRIIVPDRAGVVNDVSVLASGLISQMQRRFGP